VKKVKSRFNLEVLTFIQFRIFSSSQKPKDFIYINLNFYLFLYGCEIWFLTLGEEHRLRVSENRCRGKYLNLRERKEQEAGENGSQSLCVCTSAVFNI
jgi:hypothetical protein